MYNRSNQNNFFLYLFRLHFNINIPFHRSYYNVLDFLILLYLMTLIYFFFQNVCKNFYLVLFTVPKYLIHFKTNNLKTMDFNQFYPISLNTNYILNSFTNFFMNTSNTYDFDCIQ